MINTDNKKETLRRNEPKAHFDIKLVLSHFDFQMVYLI